MLVLHAREVVLQGRCTVGQPVTLLSRNVTAPVRHLNIALQQPAVRERAGELVANADFLHSTCGDLAIRTVCEACPLLLRINLPLGVELGGEHGRVWDVGCGELELGLLLEGRVGGGGVRGKGVEDVLLVVLGDLCGERLEGGEDEVGD